MYWLEKVKQLFKQQSNTKIEKNQKDNDMSDVQKIDQIRHTNKLSDNFTLTEMLKSQTASRRGISNNPTDDHLLSLDALVDNVLQPLRERLGLPINVSSGYRSQELNDAIGGSESSQHSKGEAADIECFGLSNKELAYTIMNNYEFDQLILEFYNPAEGPNSGWIHVSYKRNGRNRKEVLTAMKENGKTVYSYGITNK